MTPERWQQVRDVLGKALELAPRERSDFLDSACSSDQSLRQEVESLLASSDDVRSDFLQSSSLRVTITAGTKLGDYEVKSLLGSGGMGEVYRARDSRLGRDVAIKVLPSFLSADSDRLRRFEQEARAAAALNHPNILAVHQMGTYQGAPYLVSELLEGETLRAQLNRGRLAVRKAIDYGVQIARGLATAHEKGIVHRDLKPENLFVSKDGRVKILDFGLAKLTQPQFSPENAELTLTKGTEAGMVMGTVGYMSPEQVRGQTADHRADIFAFGAILYEMLAGKRAFQKPTSADTMAAILNEDPPGISQVTANIPPALHRVVHRCLEKNPEQRFQSASDLAFALDALSESAGSGTSATSRVAKLRAHWGWLAVAFATLVGVSVIGLWFHFRGSAASPASAVEVVPLVSMPGKQSTPAFSPDGNQVAFRAYEGPRPGIYTMLVGGEKPLQLTDSILDCCPTWSPDGKQIAFVRRSEDKWSFYAVPALGGRERLLYAGASQTWLYCDKLDWSPDGRYLMFSEFVDNSVGAPLALLALSDLTVRHITSPANQQFDCAASFSPDGSTVAFVRGGMSADHGDLFALKFGDRDPIRLTSGNSGGPLAWTADGKQIVFSSAMGGLQNLWRMPATGGMPRPIEGAGGQAYRPSIARRGDQVVYEQVNKVDTIWQLHLKDERHPLGSPTRLLAGRGFVWKSDFSPDGKKIAFESNRMGYADIWVCDSDGSNCSQLTSLHGLAATARWSPDGRYIAFEAITKNFWEVYLLEYPGGTPHELPTFPGANNGVPRWSRDGQWIYFYSTHNNGTYELWKIPFKGGTPTRVRTGKGGIYVNESPDRRFLYYAKWGEAGLWKMPLEGGQETRVLDHFAKWYWTLAQTGIYFLDYRIQPYGRLEFLDFATRSTTPIFTLEKPVPQFGGLTLSPDGKSLLFGQNEIDECYIMLVKNFR
jgi:Tol biopolymer transport system component